MTDERRTIRRFLFWLPVRLEAGGETVDGRIYDISGRGGFVWCETLWPVGTELQLSLEPPGDVEPVVLHSKVIRVEQEHGLEGMAVAFTRVDESAATFIRLFLDMQDRPTPGPSTD